MFKDRLFFISLLPAAVILAFIGVIYLFCTEMFPVNYDDSLYNALLKNHSLWQLTKEMAGKYSGQYICHFDGRVFSNVFLLLVFSVVKTKVSVYFIYNICIFLLLGASFFLFYKSLIRKGIFSFLSEGKTILLSILSACLLFLFVIEGRYEVFYWLCSTGNHLLSIILFLFLFNFFLSKPSFLSTLAFSLIAFCIGQMNEVYAASYLFIFLFLSLHAPKAKAHFFFVCLALLSGLLLNVFAPGTLTRVTTLSEYDAHFNLTYSLKNTLATFYQPFIHWKHLPFKLLALLLLLFFLRNYLKLQITLPVKATLHFNRLLLLGALTGVFLHCNILGDVCFYRCLLFFYLSMMYFAFLMMSKGAINPLKLFFS